jgi:hypothetical protein
MSPKGFFHRLAAWFGPEDLESKMTTSFSPDWSKIYAVGESTIETSFKEKLAAISNPDGSIRDDLKLDPVLSDNLRDPFVAALRAVCSHQNGVKLPPCE